MKNEKGITLIALVITIIVLLILAGVSIAMLTGDNGLLTKSKESAAASAVAGAKDEIALEFQDQMTENLQNRYTPGANVSDVTAKTVVDGMTESAKHDCKVVYSDVNNNGESTITITYPSTASGEGDYQTVGTITKDDNGNYTLKWSK